MAIQFHIHAYPGCGSKCNSACSGMGPESSCSMIEVGQNRGMYGCVHIKAGTEHTTSKELTFFRDLVAKGYLKPAATGVKGSGKTGKTSQDDWEG